MSKQIISIGKGGVRSSLLVKGSKGIDLTKMGRCSVDRVTSIFFDDQHQKWLVRWEQEGVDSYLSNIQGWQKSGLLWTSDLLTLAEVPLDADIQANVDVCEDEIRTTLVSPTGQVMLVTVRPTKESTPKAPPLMFLSYEDAESFEKLFINAIVAASR